MALDKRSLPAPKRMLLVWSHRISRAKIFLFRRRKSFQFKSAPVTALALLWILLIASIGLGGGSTTGLQNDSPELLTDHTYFNAHIVPVARSIWNREPDGESVDAEEHWSLVKDDVAFGVKTGHELAEKRIGKLKKAGWWSVGRDVPNIIGISDEDDIGLGVVGIKRYALDMLHVNNFSQVAKGEPEEMKPVSGASFTTDELPPPNWFNSAGWKGDKDKNLPALHLLRTVFPGKKWYVLLDDDTYIFLENFAHFILQKGMDETPIYTGKIFLMTHCGGYGLNGVWKANSSEPRGQFAHGGSGIVMNSLAMDKIYPELGNCIRRFSSCWAGDIQVGLCMKAVGVRLRNSDRKRDPTQRHFVPFSPSKAMSSKSMTKRWMQAHEPMTFHKIDIEEEEVLSEFERQSIIEGKPFVFNRLLDFLLRNDIRPTPPKKSKHVDKEYTSVFVPKENQTGAGLAAQLFPSGLP